MRIAVLFFLLNIAGCPHPTPPAVTQPAPRSAATPACPASIVPAMADICDGRFTTDGYLCVNCKGATGCFDTSDAVYCAQPNCNADARCRKE